MAGDTQKHSSARQQGARCSHVETTQRIFNNANWTICTVKAQAHVTDKSLDADMRRSYDPHYGSREQLRDSAEHGMKVARERDALKIENAEMMLEILELKATIIKMTEVKS